MLRTWHCSGPKVPNGVAPEFDGFEEQSLPTREDTLLLRWIGVQIVVSPCCTGDFRCVGREYLVLRCALEAGHRLGVE